MPSDGSIQTAEGSSRKRVKISRDAGRPAGQPSKSPEVVSLISSPQKSTALPAAVPDAQTNGHSNGTPCHHEQAFKSLNGDLDAMRQLITCKICDRFLYEPYSLTCGHTYCYSCLSSWMVDNHKKTCPDCRAVIKDQPAPSYVIREMVLIFTSKSELLPDGETSEEHVQLAKEESEIVTKDKANTDIRKGGLFKGHFKRGSRAAPLDAIRDHADNVFRCPRCINEVEDGWCLHCNVRVRTGEDDDDSDNDTFSDESLDLDHDLDAVDHDGVLDAEVSDWSDYAEYLGDQRVGDHRHVHDFGFGPAADGTIHLYSEDESEDDEEDHDEMDGFIDDNTIAIDDDDDDSDEESDGTATARRPQAVQPAPIYLSDDEEEDRPAPRRRRLVAAFRRPRAAAQSAGASQSSDADDSEDEGPVPANSQRSRGRGQRTRQRPIAIDSDDDEHSDETQTTSRSVHGGFSPLQPGNSSGLEEEDGHHQRSVSVSSEGTIGNGTFDFGQDDDDHDDDEHEGDSIHGGSESLLYGGNSIEEDDHDDGMSDESDDHNTPMNEFPINPNTPMNGFPANPYSHRLHTMGPHSVRHAEPSVYTRQLPFPQPTYPPYRYSHPYTSSNFIAPAAVYPPTQDQVYGAPTHPFGLGNVLSRIQQQHPQTTNHRFAPTRAARSNVSSQSSSGGGVDVGASEGSSQTVRGDEGSGRRRRRRYDEIDEDDEY